MRAYALAERLGMTCGELLGRMTSREFTGWIVYDAAISKMQNENAAENRVVQKINQLKKRNRN